MSIQYDSVPTDCEANMVPDEIKDFEWHFLLAAKPKPNLIYLNEVVQKLLTAAKQKIGTARVSKDKSHVTDDELKWIMWDIVYQTTVLVLSDDWKKIREDLACFPAVEQPEEYKTDTFNALLMGGQELDIPLFEEAVNNFYRAVNDHNNSRKCIDIDWYGLDKYMWPVIIEATAFVLSGSLENLRELEGKNETEK